VISLFAMYVPKRSRAIYLGLDFQCLPPPIKSGWQVHHTSCQLLLPPLKDLAKTPHIRRSFTRRGSFGKQHMLDKTHDTFVRYQSMVSARLAKVLWAMNTCLQITISLNLPLKNFSKALLIYRLLKFPGHKFYEKPTTVLHKIFYLLIRSNNN